MSAAVTLQQRHRRGHPCPICEGHDAMPRGKGKRCSGFTGADGTYAHCSREEYAGGIAANGANLYAHRLHGPCRCGVTHGADTEIRIVDTIETTYGYTDERGDLLFEVVRKPGKQFLQRRPDGAGGWAWGTKGVRRVPYRLRELVEDAAEDRPVYIVEGEKDADALAKRGYLATCNPGGAGKWSAVAPVARDVLRDRDVIIVADADDVGRKHALEVFESLRGVARSLVTKECPTPHKDVSDLLAAGRALTELVPLRTEAEVASAKEAPRVVHQPAYVLESAEEIAEPLPPIDWICEGLRIARGSLTIVGGYGYSRKTLYTQDLALAVATGTDALGVYRTAQGPVVHVDLEQGKRITRERYQRMARAQGIELRAAKLNVVTFPRFRLSDRDARDTLRRLLEETGASLLVVDSLRASVAGVDENSSEIREYLDLLGQECKRADAAGIIIHHARKPAEGRAAGRYSLRGSSGIFDAADGVFVFAGEKGEPTTVTHEKDRLIGTELDSFGLDTEDVERDGDPRWGLRLVHMEGEQMAERDEQERVAAVEAKAGKAADEIRAHLARGPFAGSKSQLRDATGINRTDFFAGFRALELAGHVAVSGSQRAQTITLVRGAA